MTGLLAADRIIVLEHFFQYIAVTYSGFDGLAAMSLHSLMQADVTHNSGYQHIVMQLVALHQLQSANQHNLVAVHSLAVFVNYQAAVGVAVIGDTYMSANLDNLLLQSLQMSGAAAVVDVDAVRLVENCHNLSTETAQDNRCDFAVGTVGAVHNNLQTVQLSISSAQNVLNIQCGQILFMNNLADAAAAYCLSVINRCSNDSCNFVLYCVRQLVTCLREEFDAVVFKRIVRSRNYYTGVSLNLTGQKGNCRSRHNAQKMCIAASAADTCCQSAFQHLSAAACISADNNFRAGNLAAKVFCGSIAQLKGQLRSKLYVRYTANTISTK